MAVKKITKRWLINSFGIILVIIIALVVSVSVAVKSFYYNSVQQYVLSRADAVTSQLDNFARDKSINFSIQVRRLVEDFEYKNKMELMALDSSGNILITSSGFESSAQLDMPDYKAALASGDGVGVNIGFMGSEKVMAVSCLTHTIGEDLSAMRYVVSLSRVDEQIVMFIFIATLVGISIILFVIFSSSYFINSIIIPIGEVGQTAKQIAQGDFSVRLDPRNDDEIGELCVAINNMAEELSNSEKVKNDFISSVSHELRTPLTAIRGWGETIMSAEEINPDTLQKGMHVIMNEAERLSSMVEDLLDFSRMQSGRLHLELEKLDIIAELSDAVLMFTQRAAQENKALYYHEPEEFAVVMGDKNRLRQVFVNILDNALKYSDSGDSVTISATVGDCSMTVSVTDTGCGISQEDLPKVKGRFYKGKTNRRGSGIGLAVADEIVQMHGGHLELESQKNVGTTVTITLPVSH
ncbi:MAG: HAMP domain-containing sensor histidine kinase [Angelakisella sp.]|nr:HAMP domain-containing sensor histidine kinase [Angelakisella sp.]